MNIHKIIACLALWSVVGFIILRIEPSSIKNIGIKDSYSPLVVALFVAMFYSTSALIESVWVAITISLLVTLSLVLALAQIMNAFLAVVIMAMIIFALYVHFYSS